MPLFVLFGILTAINAYYLQSKVHLLPEFMYIFILYRMSCMFDSQIYTLQTFLINHQLLHSENHKTLQFSYLYTVLSIDIDSGENNINIS